jgi:hypothetical protein
MIARMWRGAVRTEDADAYATHIARLACPTTPRRLGTAERGCCHARPATGPSS